MIGHPADGKKFDHSKDCIKPIHYDDGQYTWCSSCVKAEACPTVIKCNCGEIHLVAYEKRADAFLCEKCNYELI
jgi:hypothetical protein